MALTIDPHTDADPGRLEGRVPANVRHPVSSSAGGCPGNLRFDALRKRGAAHPTEEVGARLRERMPWLEENRLVDRSNN